MPGAVADEAEVPVVIAAASATNAIPISFRFVMTSPGFLSPIPISTGRALIYLKFRKGRRAGGWGWCKRVSDDYPAVLPQMKRLGATILFVGDYVGQGATREQFIKTFATASIRVVFAADVKVTDG